MSKQLESYMLACNLKRPCDCNDTELIASMTYLWNTPKKSMIANELFKTYHREFHRRFNRPATVGDLL